MTSDGKRVRPKRYGLLKGQIQVPEDFDAPLELAEFGMTDTHDEELGSPKESSGLTLEDRARVEQEIEEIVRFHN